MEVWKTRDGSEVAVLAATWELNHKITFESLHKEFESNPVKAWRNYGSRVTHDIESAIKDKAAVLRACNTSREHPWDYVRGQFKPWFRGKPGVRYFLHYDLSVRRDATGVGLVHRELDGRIVVDFMWQEVIAEGKNINFAKMRGFAYQLTSLGFHIELITYDQFQSEETRQILEEKGYQTDRESADRNTVAYDTLIEFILTTTPQNRRIDYYNYPVFIQEMEELKLVNGIRYDHPKKNRRGGPGSKDVADAVACATKRAIMFALENPEQGPPMIRVHQNREFAVKYGDERSPF